MPKALCVDLQNEDNIDFAESLLYLLCTIFLTSFQMLFSMMNNEVSRGFALNLQRMN